MMRLARRKLLVAVAAALILASAVGAVKMLRLRSYGWSNASGVLALLPIPSGLFWPIGLLIGIWALVVLGRDDVKAAFRKRWNPIGLPDVHDPDGPDAQAIARSGDLPGRTETS